MLRVATWNLWGRFGPWEERQPAIAATLAGLDADVVGLQEVWFDDAGDHQADWLARGLDWPTAVAVPCAVPAGRRSRAALGNAVLSRWPLLDWHAQPLPDVDGRPGPRTVVHARLDHPAGPLDVFTTHLDHRPDGSRTRQAQVATVAAFVARHRGDPERSFPPILTGDLNAPPTSDEVRMLTGETAVPVRGIVFRDAWVHGGDGSPGFTWHRDNPWLADALSPQRRLDYVLVGWPRRKGLGRVASCRVVDQPVDGVQPSDHYAVVADLHTEPPSAPTNGVAGDTA